jgi:Tol biopolymer transport system component/predicted Ser/Thr protein kinase
MGVVYKAYDTNLDRIVAVKVLRQDGVARPLRQSRLFQEAKAASTLNHPNILTVYDVDETDGVQFISMEYVPGKTLDQVIGSKRLPISEALTYALQIADALARAHAAGIVHRDLKPSNIILGDDGRIRVLDFGLAKLTQPEKCGDTTVTMPPQEYGTLTREGAIVGTVAYMSPEQAEGKRVDARTDIFSFGAVLYEMITGQRAFQRESQAATLAAVLREHPKPARAVTDATPHALDRLVQRCLEKDVTRRWQYMSDIRIALDDIREELPGGRSLQDDTPSAWRLRPAVRLAGGILALLSVVWLWRNPPSWLGRNPRSADMISVPLTSDRGIERHPTLSPDGNQVAFSSDSERRDNYDIYVRMIGAETSVRLTSDPAVDWAPAWSPDGRSIVFARTLHNNKVGLFQIAANGGPERKLTETHAGPTPHHGWFPDSRHLALSDTESAGEPAGLFLFSVETREKRRLTRPPPGMVGDCDPAISPDGRTLAFVRVQATGAADLHLLRLDDSFAAVSEPIRITHTSRITGRPVWTGSGRELIYSAGRSAADLSLWRLNIASPGSARRVFTTSQNCYDPVICASRRRLVYARREYDVDIWKAELPGRGQLPEGSPLRILSSTRPEFVAQFSPDGTKIVFHSERSGGSEIWLSNADGSNPVQLTSLNAPISGSPRWSPDGGRIVFDSNREGQFELYTIDAAGGGMRRRTDHPADDAVASWSSDGRFIYFGSNRTGAWQIWKIPADNGEPVQVTTAGGYVPFESTDGRFVYYSRSSGRTSLWRVPSAGGAETQVLDSLIWLNFTPVRDGIYFMPASGGTSTTPILFFGFADEKIQKVWSLDKPPAFGLSVSPDQRWVLYSQLERDESDLMLVDDFR